MPYRIQNGETIDQGVRRLLHERVRRARSELAGKFDDAVVHEVRQELKRLRALLALVRPMVRPGKFRQQRRCLRRCSAELSDSRDARVRLESLSLIAAAGRPAIATRHWAALTRQLREGSLGHIRQLVHGRSPQKIRRRLKGFDRRFQSTPVCAGEGQRVLTGIVSSYRKARRALRRVHSNPSTRNLHSWRRCTKRLWHQLVPVQNSLPSSLATWTQKLDQLGASLGEDHDLFLLSRFLRRKGDETLSKKERDGLLQWIQTRRLELVESVTNQGRGVFAATPSRFQTELRRPGRNRRPTPFEDAGILRTAVASRVDQVPMISRRATPPSVRLRGRPSGSRNSALGDKPNR